MLYTAWWLCAIYRTLASVINVRNNEIISAFGIRVRALRQERGYTMEKFAELAGIDYRQLSDIELGKTNITISTIYALAKGLKLTVSELTNLKGF
jgi:transcriptional regulator with XRE-family HTH domain